MEIQDLQQLFQAAEHNALPNMNAAFIEQTVRRQSQLVLERIDRAMQRKTYQTFTIGLFAFLASSVFFLDPDDSFLLDQFLSPVEMTVLCAAMGLLTLLVATQNWRAHRQIIALQRNSPDLQNGLRETIKILKHSQAIKVNSDAIGLPFFASCILLAAYYPLGSQWDWGLLVLAVIVVLLLGLSRKLAVAANQTYLPYIEALEAAYHELSSESI